MYSFRLDQKESSSEDERLPEHILEDRRRMTRNIGDEISTLLGLVLKGIRCLRDIIKERWLRVSYSLRVNSIIKSYRCILISKGTLKRER